MMMFFCSFRLTPFKIRYRFEPTFYTKGKNLLAVTALSRLMVVSIGSVADHFRLQVPSDGRNPVSLGRWWVYSEADMGDNVSLHLFPDQGCGLTPQNL